MQEINLLQNKLKDKTHQWEQSNRTVIVLLVLVLIAEVVGGGMLYFLTKSAEESKIALDQENVGIQSRLDQMAEDTEEAKGFQAQTKNIQTLLRNHVIWTGLMDSLQETTFKNSRYLSMASDTSGLVHLEGNTPTYSELGKVLLALETNENVDTVRLLSTNPASDENPGVNFSLDVSLNTNIFLNKE